MMTLPEVLVKLRTERNVTQAEIARQTGISLRAYQLYEYGKQEPTVSKLLALADFYQVSTDELLGRKEIISDLKGPVNSEPQKTNLPGRLLQLRTDRHLKQTDISRQTGMPVRSYQHYERGEQEPTLSRLVTLADFFGVTLDDLAGRVPPGDERKEG